MATIQELYTQSLLAQAAYADLVAGTPNISALRVENKSNMTLDQATDFASKWTVVDQYSDASGAGATIFQENATGKKYLAIRGTTPTDIGDLNADYIFKIIGDRPRFSAQMPRKPISMRPIGQVS